MLKFGKISTKFRGILTVLALTAITFTVTSCKGKEQSPINFDEKYLSVDGYEVTKGEVWEELQWDASQLFDEKARTAIVNKHFEDVKTVMADSSHEKHKAYTERIQNYLVEAIYNFDFSLEDHDEEIEKLDEKAKDTAIKKFADTVYKRYKTKLTQEQIIEAIKANDLDALKELYSLFYLPLASELFAYEKLQEEIDKKDKEYAEDKDDDTIGYFTKTEIVSKYKKEYLNQGDSSAVAIKFASQKEADETLKAFGIKVYKGKFYFLNNTEHMNFVEYKKYYDKFDFETAKPEDYLSIEGIYGQAAVLQLYIAMYNYIFTYHQTALTNINIITNKVIETKDVLDQRSTTRNIINIYEEFYANTSTPDSDKTDAEKDEENIKKVVEAIKKDDTNKELISYTAEEATKVNDDFYTLLYSTLKTPAQHETEGGKGSYERYNTATKSIDGGYYLVFKIDQQATEDDKLYKKDITEDDLYENIKNNETMYKKIIKDLTDAKINKEFIDNKVNDCKKDVKVKIFDKEIEIAYSKDHKDYTKTLTGAPNNNTIAEFKYNDTVIKYELTTEDGKGIWDILEYRDGTATAVDILQTKKIKDSQEYKSIDDKDMDLYRESLEYILASFANGGLEQQGYPASLGKYNFLMLYYHSADIDQIISDIFKVNKATAKILTNYSDDKVKQFFFDYSKRAYDNYFSITAKQVNLFLDINEDGKPDDITTWENNLVNFPGEEQKITMLDVAKKLYSDIYNRILASNEDHATALQKFVDEYNASGRFNPNEGDRHDNNGNYDPIANEWEYAKYKKLGFNISIEEITVTNSDSDKNIKIKDKLHSIYKSEGFAYNDFFPSKYLENPEDADALIKVDNKLNYFVVTGASKPASAKYESHKDKNGIYQNLYFMYNETVQKVENIYNTEDFVNMNQIEAFIYEYLDTKTTNLVPQDITTALNTFVSPVLTRYQAEVTQQHISINYIANGDKNNLSFADTKNLAHYIELQEINKREADNYTVFDNEKYDNFYNWFENINKLSKGGNN